MIVEISERVRTIEELHAVLKRRLELPDYYGENLDALWDCLTGYVDLPLTVKWSNFQQVRSNLVGYANRLEVVLRRAESEIEGFQVVFK